MASIPLPALHVDTPQQPNLLQQYGQLMQLRALAGQQQLQQQQIQGAGLENQQRQIQIQNSQAGMKAMQQWDGKSYDDLPDLMAKNGADLNTVMNAKAGIMKIKQDAANLTKDQLANDQTKNDFLVQQLDNVKSLPPDQQPAGFQKAIQDS